MKLFRGTCYFLAAVCILCLLYYRVWFLRKPERKIPHNAKVYVSPANGKIVSIRRWNQDTLAIIKGDMGLIRVWTKDVDTAGTMVCIQMDPTNVHFQRAPQDGKLIAQKYSTGNFHNAVTMCNEYGIRFENEHNEMLFETPAGKKIKVIQIAGFLARRIVSELQLQQEVKQGDEIGLIKFGSQVTVILPHDVAVAAKTGDVVVDGETVIGNDE